VTIANDLLVLVPARGGSKGLPRKNARRLGDLSLLGWTVEAVRAAGLSGALWLSTDDQEIAEIGRAAGLDVPFLRPAELATDAASAVAVALHALDHYAAIRGQAPNTLMLLQPTSPFRRPESLRDAVGLLASDHTLDAVLGVKPIYRTLATLYHEDDAQRIHPVASEASALTRRQDVRPLLTACGALYLVRCAALRRENTFVPARTRALPMDQLASIDIDDPLDWAIATAVAAAGISWRSAETAGCYESS
jgi:N-acylneuraminate cytidylyltransferase/CMP-N,N'-diacetyllegionaminic acid synthase